MGNGGWREFVCAFDKLKVSGKGDSDWWQLVDTATLQVVLES